MHIVANAISRSSADTARIQTAVALIVVNLLLSGYVLLLEPILQWDTHVSHLMQTWRTPALDQLMLSITMLADLPLSLTLMTGVAMWLLARGDWWLCLYTACAFFSTTLSVTVLKYLTQRARPTLAETGVHLMSFPSGHAARAVIVLGLLALLLSWGRSRSTKTTMLGVAAVLSTLVGISRVYLGVHWPSDVLAGAALAALMLLCLDWQWQRADDGPVQVNTSAVLIACVVLYLGYRVLSIDSQGPLYGLQILS